MDVGQNDQMEVVTDKKEPSPEVRFKYVYIPCDMSQPVEEVSRAPVVPLHSMMCAFPFKLVASSVFVRRFIANLFEWFIARPSKDVWQACMPASDAYALNFGLAFRRHSGRW